jgi:hypothetical protein
MLQKFKITSCAFILCLFGLTLITVSPVFAERFEESARVLQCEQSNSAEEKTNCFRDFARGMYDSLSHQDRVLKDSLLATGAFIERSNRCCLIQVCIPHKMRVWTA